jgi:hypothetical protein
MKLRIVTVIILLYYCAGLRANSDVRTWMDVSGQKFSAELVSYDPSSEKVVLMFDDTEEMTYQFSQFSTFDQAWLVEWVEFEADLDSVLAGLGGRVEHVLTAGAYPTDLFIYYPSEAAEMESDTLPLMILFHPGGKAARYLKRHVEAAEDSGLILVACGSFRNTNADTLLETELLKRFKEVFAYIVASVQFDHSKAYLGGTSGGAWRAFHYSAWIDWPWAGIYSSGGWLGGYKYYREDYPALKVAMVNGSNDRSASAWLESDANLLEQHDCEVAVIAFEGGHQVPPTGIQKKAFFWLLGFDEYFEN